MPEAMIPIQASAGFTVAWLRRFRAAYSMASGLRTSQISRSVSTVAGVSSLPSGAWTYGSPSMVGMIGSTRWGSRLTVPDPSATSATILRLVHSPVALDR